MLAFFHSFLLLFGWRWPTPLDAAMLFGTGFINAVGQWFWTKALHLAPAPAVSPFYYLMLVWALVIGFVVWGDVPTREPAHRFVDRGGDRPVPVFARGAAATAIGQAAASVACDAFGICGQRAEYAIGAWFRAKRLRQPGAVKLGNCRHKASNMKPYGT